jgi:hypothetical protein
VTDVEESARRLANVAHVLRELVHLTAAHIAREPRFEAKCLLADHLHDDALAAAGLYERIAQLHQPAHGPGPELAALLDRIAAAPDYLEAAYGELKPALIASARTQLAQLDAVLEEPALRLLTQLVHRQERHTTELPASVTAPLPDLAAYALGDERRRSIQPAQERPARDAFVEIADQAEPPQDLQHYAHALLQARLEAAEHAARTLHESGGLDVPLARRAWDGVRHAEAVDQLMATELGCHWGDFPVAFGAPPPAEPPEPPPPAMARVLDYIRAESA